MLVNASQKINLLLFLHPHPFLFQLLIELMFCHFEHIIAHNLRNGPVLPFVFEHCHFLLLLSFFLLASVVTEMGPLEELGSLVCWKEWKQSPFMGW